MRALSLLLVPGIFALAVHAGAQQAVSVSRCHDLAGERILHGVIDKAEWVSAGAWNAPGPGPAASQPLNLPDHCALHVVSRPTADSLINITVWLPAPEAWNRKLLATGNGGYSSALSYRDMADGLQKGYAVGGSDTGHTGEDLSFGTQHVERIRDWAYRATHELAIGERETTQRFYGQKPMHAYFRGCSTGGQEALSEAQRYPEDFDGILAGDPGSDRILLNADFVMSWLTTHPTNGPRLTHAKLDLLAAAVMQTCDKVDGVADGIINDPRMCKFNPDMLRCKPGQDPAACLTSEEVGAVQTLYDGPVRNGAHQRMYFGWERGSEAGWGAYLVDPNAPVRSEFWKDWVYGDPTLDLRSFDPAKAVAEARRKLPFTEAVDPDLSPFFQHGGKLLMYHGWADPVVPPEDSIAYFHAARERSNGDGLALFMVPGMSHCGGGSGASDFDALESLDHWVTSGAQPTTILARKLEKGQSVLERPLCAYPQEAVWDKKHDPTKASSFSCKTLQKEAAQVNDTIR